MDGRRRIHFRRRSTLHGRAVLVKGYTQFFEKNPKVQLECKVDSLHFVSHRQRSHVEKSPKD